MVGDTLCFERDINGEIPLHLASRAGNVQVLENGLLNYDIWCRMEEEEEEEEEGEINIEDIEEEDEEIGKV